MLKPSGGFFKKMFNPKEMVKRHKKVFGGVGKALGGGFGMGAKKKMPGGMGRPAPPKPILTKSPTVDRTRPNTGEVRTMPPRGGDRVRAY